jgi:hypothetical protein
MQSTSSFAVVTRRNHIHDSTRKIPHPKAIQREEYTSFATSFSLTESYVVRKHNRVGGEFYFWVEIIFLVDMHEANLYVMVFNWSRYGVGRYGLMPDGDS